MRFYSVDIINVHKLVSIKQIIKILCMIMLLKVSDSYHLGHTKLMLCFTDPVGVLFSKSQIKCKSCNANIVEEVDSSWYEWLNIYQN